MSASKARPRVSKKQLSLVLLVALVGASSGHAAAPDDFRIEFDPSHIPPSSPGRTLAHRRAWYQYLAVPGFVVAGSSEWNYQAVNEGLRTGRLDESHPHIKAMDEAFDHVRPLDRPVQLYRALKEARVYNPFANPFSSQQWRTVWTPPSEIGQTMVDRGFGSMTPDYDQARHFGNHVFRLTLPPGTLVIDPMTVAGRGYVPNKLRRELVTELVLPRNMEYTIVGYSTTEWYHYDVEVRPHVTPDASLPGGGRPGFARVPAPTSLATGAAGIVLGMAIEDFVSKGLLGRPNSPANQMIASGSAWANRQYESYAPSSVRYAAGVLERGVQVAGLVSTPNFWIGPAGYGLQRLEELKHPGGPAWEAPPGWLDVTVFSWPRRLFDGMRDSLRD